MTTIRQSPPPPPTVDVRHEMNLTIAEYIGWKIKWSKDKRTSWCKPPKSGKNRPWNKGLDIIPNYCSDLNTIHEAYMSISANIRDLVNSELADITAGGFDCSETHDFDCVVNATAFERANALYNVIQRLKKNDKKRD